MSTCDHNAGTAFTLLTKDRDCSGKLMGLHLLCQLSDHFEILHRARQSYCHALCKISKSLDN